MWVRFPGGPFRTSPSPVDAGESPYGRDPGRHRSTPSPRDTRAEGVPRHPRTGRHPAPLEKVSTPNESAKRSSRTGKPDKDLVLPDHGPSRTASGPEQYLLNPWTRHEGKKEPLLWGSSQRTPQQGSGPHRPDTPTSRSDPEQGTEGHQRTPKGGPAGLGGSEGDPGGRGPRGVYSSPRGRRDLKTQTQSGTQGSSTSEVPSQNHGRVLSGGPTLSGILEETGVCRLSWSTQDT